MRDVKKMTLDDIYKNMQNLKLFPYDIVNITKDFSTYINIMEKSNMDTWNFIKKHEDAIDKEKLVYVLTEKAMGYLIQTRGIFDKDRYKVEIAYQNGIKFLSGCKRNFPLVSAKNGRFVIEKVGNISDFNSGPPKKVKNHELNSMIKGEVEKFTLVFGIIDDFPSFLCSSEENSNIFSNILRYNCSNEIKKQKVNDGEISEEFCMKCYTDEISDYLTRFPKEFDMDKIMLLASFRMKNALENESDKLEDYEKEEIIKCLKYYDKNLKKYISIKGNIQKSPFSPEKVDFQYSTEEFKKDFKKIINDKYYSDSELNEIKSKILNGEINLTDLENSQIYHLIKFDKDEVEKIKSNYQNFDILLKLNDMSKEEAQEIIQKNGFSINYKTIKILVSKRFISEKDIMEMYLNENISLNTMIDIIDDGNYNVEVTSQELLKKYEEFLEEREDDKKLARLKRYGKLSKEINSKGVKKQEDFYEEIIEELYSNNDDIDLDELYDLDVLPIQTLIDWDGEERIYKLVENLKLKTEDVENLIKEDKLTIQKMGNALVKSKFSKLDKINYICDSFSYPCSNQQENEERDIVADTLSQYVELGDKIKEVKEEITPGNGGHRNPANHTIKRKKYVSDVLARWRLFKELDNNCKITGYFDGTTRFDLPNVNGGTVVFEKTLKLVVDQMIPDYAKATYVMSYSDYIKNRAKIEQQVSTSNNSQTSSNGLGINRKTLIDMYNKGQADKIIHSPAWGKKVKEKLGNHSISLYGRSKEDRIDSLIKKIEKSRTLID